jgi:hypothetical protein
MDYSKDNLSDLLNELKPFLLDLDRVLPGKVDADLISFVESALAHPWQLQLLHNSLAQAKSATSGRRP